MANTYTIAQGDTLSGIAAKNNTTVSALASANGITDPNKITAGSTINIPGTQTSAGASAPNAISVTGIQTAPPVAPIVPPVNNQTAQNGLGVTANGVTNAAGASTSGSSTTTTTTPAAGGTTSGTSTTGTDTSTTPITNISQVTDQKSLASYLQYLIGQQAGEGDFTNTQNSTDNGAGSVNSDTAALADINNKALQTSKAYDDQIQSLQENNPQGQFGGGLDISVNDLTRQKNQDMANIGILQNVATNNLAAANAIVTQKVNAQYEPIANEISSLQNLASVYSNDMTDSEKLQAQTAIDQKTAAAKVISDAYQSALSSAVANGAPQSILTAIDTAANAPGATAATIAAALGPYGVNKLDQEAKIASINASNASTAASERASQTQNIILPNGMIVTSSGSNTASPEDIKTATDASNQAGIVNQLQVLYNKINTGGLNANDTSDKNAYNSLLATLPKATQDLLPTLGVFSGGPLNNTKKGNAQFGPAIASLNSTISSVIPGSTPPPYGQVFSTPQDAQTYFTSTGQQSQYATEVAEANAIAQKAFKRNANDGEILQVINGQ